MKDLVKEMDFTTLKENFDEICDEVNRGDEAVTLTLKSGRTVFIMPEKKYDSISRFITVDASTMYSN